MITKSIQDKYKRVVPMPKKAVFNDELVQLGADWKVEFANDCERIAAKWMFRFRLSNHAGNKVVMLNIDNMLGEEEYKIYIAKEKLEVWAGSQKGLDYALKTLWQISPEGLIPTGYIEDKPSLNIRGFHINFDSFRQMDIEEAIYAIKIAADLKLNTILLEYGNRFPYKDHERIAVSTTLRSEDIRKLVDTAKEYDMTVIPLQQTIGHLDYMLWDPYYTNIRENGNSMAQICPLNLDAKTVVKGLIENMIEAHPGIEFLHIGGDEARSLGVCPACSEKVEKHGISRLYIDYINEISELVISKGITPIVWDDMLCAHPEALDMLDKRIVILYWDYWTVSKSTPYFVARYDSKGRGAICHDSRWETEWNDALSDLEREIMSKFSRGLPLEEALGDDFMKLYGPWLGDEFPKRIKGYPYIEFYKAKGFKVIGAPTSLGNGDNYNSLPNYWRFIPNIRTASERCIEAGAEGMITTAWYNYHPSMFHLGIGATAQFAWG